MTDSEIYLGLPRYEISNIQREGGTITVSARYTGPISCPRCGGSQLRNKGWCRRTIRHEDWGFRHVMLNLEVRKSRCLECGHSFRQRLPGVQPFQRASESFQEMVYQQHLDGINRSRLGRRKGIGAATVQRYFLRHLQRRARQDHAPLCPKILGIDEHFFTRKKGYATTFCDLKNHRIYDITLGRSEAALESYFLSLEGKEQVRIVCMDLATVYRSIVHQHFPKAVIVADRFHVNQLAFDRFLGNQPYRPRSATLRRLTAPPAVDVQETSGSGLLGTAPRGAAADGGKNQNAWQQSRNSLSDLNGDSQALLARRT